MALFGGSKSSSTTEIDSSGIQAGGDVLRTQDQYKESVLGTYAVQTGDQSSVSLTSSDPAVVQMALQTTAQVLGKQIDLQREWSAAAMQTTRDQYALALGDVNTARSASLEDSAKARQADGGRAEKIVLFGLGAVVLLGVAGSYFRGKS